MREQCQQHRYFHTFLAFAIYFQAYFFVHGNKEKKSFDLDAKTREQIKLKLNSVIGAWSWLGEGHHNTLVILGIFLMPFSPYPLIAAFAVIAVLMNIWWLICEFWFGLVYSRQSKSIRQHVV